MKVFYCDEATADIGRHLSPSSLKPRLLLEYLQARETITVARPEPVTLEQLYAAHAPDYVDAILAGQEYNGFDNRSLAVAYSLPWTCGSLLSAARAALTDGIACSLSSGFHHAHYASAAGFCTFNGLMVSALALRLPRLLILDCDYHYGDGTDDILRVTQAPGIQHETLGHRYRRPDQAEEYLDRLRRLPLDADLILYQAGADVHVDDPLGGLLTTEQMGERDRIVFSRARAAGVPIAWNLAGGYQRDAQDSIAPVLALHHQTYRAAAKVFSEGRGPGNG